MSDPIPLDPRFPQGFCPRHRLPLAPGGTCPLCGPVAGPSRRQLVLIYLFAAVAVVGGGYLVLHMWRQMDEPAQPLAREARADRTAPRRAPPVPDAEVEVETEMRAPEARAPEVRRSRGVSPGSRIRPRTGGWEVIPSSEGRRPGGQAHGTQTGLDPSHPVMQAERVVVRPVSITMYMTRWCPHCTRARSWLRSKRLPFREVNVESDKTGAAELRQLNPRGGVPTFNVDGRVMVGFSPAALAAAVEMARERRAGGPATVE